jgi:Ca-activated chloride channel homolog
MQKIKNTYATFMIASDPYLQKSVQEFTETNNGKAFFAWLDRLGHLYLKILKAEERRPCIEFYLPLRRFEYYQKD